MERIIKSLVVFVILSLVCLPVRVSAEEPLSDSVLQVKKELPHTEFSSCIKTFPLTVEKLYYLTLAATNEYNYEIRELQSKSGYIIFETGYRKFLASIIYVSANKSMLKITPYSGNYDFSPEIPKKVFSYIETYQNEKY